MKLKNQIAFHYDKEVDVLYANIGDQKPATSIEKGNGTTIRLDPSSGKIIGFTVIHYMKRIKKGLLKSIPEFEGIDLPNY